MVNLTHLLCVIMIITVLSQDLSPMKGSTGDLESTLKPNSSISRNSTDADPINDKPSAVDVQEPVGTGIISEAASEDSDIPIPDVDASIDPEPVVDGLEEALDDIENETEIVNEKSTEVDADGIDEDSTEDNEDLGANDETAGGSALINTDDTSGEAGVESDSDAKHAADQVSHDATDNLGGVDTATIDANQSPEDVSRNEDEPGSSDGVANDLVADEETAANDYDHVQDSSNDQSTDSSPNDDPASSSKDIEQDTGNDIDGGDELEDALGEDALGEDALGEDDRGEDDVDDSDLAGDTSIDIEDDGNEDDEDRNNGDEQDDDFSLEEDSTANHIKEDDFPIEEASSVNEEEEDSEEFVTPDVVTGDREVTQEETYIGYTDDEDSPPLISAVALLASVSLTSLLLCVWCRQSVKREYRRADTGHDSDLEGFDWGDDADEVVEMYQPPSPHTWRK